MRNRRQTAAVLVLLVFLLIMTLCGCQSNRMSDSEQFKHDLKSAELKIYYLDVGQADCSLIVCRGQSMLIDGGNEEDGDFVCDFLSEHCIQTLNYVVCTHPHEDHVGGLADVLENFPVETVLCLCSEYDSSIYEQFLSLADGIIIKPTVGERYALGDAEFQILGPVTDSSDLNNLSIMLKVVYGGTSFLFTGDAEEDEEQSVLDAGYDVSCDVLKVGHHGSSSSSCYRFLYEAEPSFAVISVGSGNSYGHPAESTLSRLSDADITIFRTDEDGTVSCMSDGTTLYFLTENSNEEVSVSGKSDEQEPKTRDDSESENSNDETQDSFYNADADTCDYVLNTNTMCFHMPDCRKIDDMNTENIAFYAGDRQTLINAGYTSCGICKA